MNSIDKVVLSPNWITVALFLSMLFLTLSKYLFQSRFFSFIILPFTNKYIALHNKKGQRFHGFHILLTLFQLINFSLFLFLCQKNILGVPLKNTVWTFFTFMGGVLLFQWVKIGLQRFQSFVFNTQDLISELIFYRTSYLNYSSLIVFIGNMILVYVLKDSVATLYGILILFFSINSIGIIRLLKDYQNVVLPYFFYFILYLCTLDIAPLVILVSYVKD